MRQRHALYLSGAMTQRLQVMAETHGVAKSQILERALKRYLANASGDPPADLFVLQQESNGRSLRRLDRDFAIATELTATLAVRRCLAEAGCTEHQIASITGHASLKEVERYTKDANQNVLATAIRKRAARKQNTNSLRHE